MADLLIKMPIPYEPKQKNRFILKFDNLGINEWFVESTSRPSINIKEQEIPFINSKRYVASSYEWESIDVTFRDPIGPSATQALMEWVRLHAESVTGRMGYAVGYKRDLELDLLDPTGVVIEKWMLMGTFLTKVDFGDLEYGEGGLVNITATLRPDYCVLVY